jgi:nucleoid-associated protein YgaU
MTAPTEPHHRSTCQRTQAAMLSVALALSTTLPAGAAFGREADQEHEGAASPQPTVPDTMTDPDYEPGGETILSFDIGDPRDGGGATDDDSGAGVPVDAEPDHDLDALAVPVDDPTEPAPDANGGSDQLAPSSEPVQPTLLPAPAPEPPPAVTAPPAADQRVAVDRRARPHGAKRTQARKAPNDRQRQRPIVRVTLPATAAMPAPAPTPAPTPTAAVAEIAPVARETAQPDRTTHTIQLGESLWSIATNLLGPGATDDEIATEVNRIYRLNRSRIGNDPDLLMPGTKLRLR